MTSRRYAGGVYYDRETSQTAYRGLSPSSRSSHSTHIAPHTRSSAPASTATSRSSERRMMGIIDIDEDQDEDGDESQDDDVSEEVDQRETSISRSGSVYSHFRSPIRSLSHHHSESNKSSTPRTQSSSNSGGQRIAQLERRLRDAEGQVEVEKRNREMAEREVRDLQSSLYAPVAKEETKRKRRSGADDDLERCLLQYAIKKSRVDPLPNDDDDFDAYLLQYAIAASNGHNLDNTSQADRSCGASRSYFRGSTSAAVAGPQGVIAQGNWPRPSRFAIPFWNSSSPPTRAASRDQAQKSPTRLSRNLINRSSREPSITVLSVSRIKAFLDSGLERPYQIDNLETLADWWKEDTLVGYGVKQKWLLAHAISEWWKALKDHVRPNIHMEVQADGRRERHAKLLALSVHPGLCIEGQVYDMQ